MANSQADSPTGKGPITSPESPILTLRDFVARCIDCQADRRSGPAARATSGARASASHALVRIPCRSTRDVMTRRSRAAAREWVVLPHAMETPTANRRFEPGSRRHADRVVQNDLRNSTADGRA